MTVKLTVKALREQIRSVILETGSQAETKLRQAAVLKSLETGPKTKQN